MIIEFLILCTEIKDYQNKIIYYQKETFDKSMNIVNIVNV
jgi:hypothetical protein